MITKLRNDQRGSSMVEVVVTIFIFSIGLLGLGSLQINALKFQKTSSQMSEVTQSAYDLSERIRANGQGASGTAYSYETKYATTVASPTLVPGCAIKICTSDEVAHIDVANWLRNLSNRLHDGAGYVIKNSVGGYDVIIMWRISHSAISVSVVDPACPSEAELAPGVGVRCYVSRVVP
jgi:type IV pilus assembly protein PilV